MRGVSLRLMTMPSAGLSSGGGGVWDFVRVYFDILHDQCYIVHAYYF